MGANRPPSEGVEYRLGSSIIKTAFPPQKRLARSARPVPGTTGRCSCPVRGPSGHGRSGKSILEQAERAVTPPRPFRKGARALRLAAAKGLPRPGCRPKVNVRRVCVGCVSQGHKPQDRRVLRLGFQGRRADPAASGCSRARPVSAFVPGCCRAPGGPGELRRNHSENSRLVGLWMMWHGSRTANWQSRSPAAQACTARGTQRGTKRVLSGTRRVRSGLHTGARRGTQRETTAGALGVLTVLTGSAAAEGVFGTSDGNGSHTRHVVSQKARASKLSASTCSEYPIRTLPASTCSEYPLRTPPAGAKRGGVWETSGFRGGRGSKNTEL
jgi:hypothetical protein